MKYSTDVLFLFELDFQLLIRGFTMSFFDRAQRENRTSHPIIPGLVRILLELIMNQIVLEMNQFYLKHVL